MQENAYSLIRTILFLLSVCAPSVAMCALQSSVQLFKVQGAPQFKTKTMSRVSYHAATSLRFSFLL